MAGEDVYVFRLGAWLAHALGAAGELAGELDTDGIGLRMPDEILAGPAVTTSAAAVSVAATKVEDSAKAIEAALDAGDEPGLLVALAGLVDGLLELLDTIRALVGAIEARVGSIGDAGERAAVEAFVRTMARQLVDYLVVSALELARPRLTFLLKLLGLIVWEVRDAGLADPGTRQYVRKELRLDRLEGLIKNPAKHLEEALGWGTGAFDPEEIFRTAAGYLPEDASFELGKLGGDAFLERGPFRWSRDSSDPSRPGLKLEVSGSFEQALTGRAELSERWGAALESDFAFAGGLTGRLRPPAELTVEPSPGASVSGGFELRVDRNPAARPFAIVGGNDLVRLSAENAAVGVGLVVGARSGGEVEVDPRAFLEMTGLTLSLGAAESDSFIASLLAASEIEGRFDLGLEWRLGDGLLVRAAGGLEIAIPMHQSLGPVELQTLYLALRITEGGAFALETSAALKGRLGPLSAAVDRIGAELTITPHDGAEGRFGPLDLELGFKPPSGVGLALEAGIVRGGGFLELDPDQGRYAGALELTFAEFLSLKAIGLVETRNPDGSPGFSLLVIITAEFGTPLQLGFGFTLNAVGGLLGLNRTMRLDELAEGVRSGAVENVMFPRDVVENAPQIISDMRRFFPSQPDTFLIGPMAKLGWGTPTLVTLSIGVVVEVPPGNVAILGVLEVALPDEDAALLVLKVKFIGAFEPDKQRLWFFASLFESRVLFITLGGEMGLLVAWGEAAEFLVSVGGFHPSFKPPPMPFPSPRRVALSILDESFARVRVEGYFAVTSNTAQFGARVELFFGVSAFNLDGHIGFDALFQFSPFYFTISFSASLSVKVFGAGVFGVKVRGELEGTSPWHVEGEGSISLLFWDIDVPFSQTWGDAVNTAAPAIEAMQLLTTELRKRESWSTVSPTGSRLLVSLREIEDSEELLLHPLGALRAQQRALPLDTEIEKVGSRPLSDIGRATLRVGTEGLRERRDLTEPFPIAQFRKLSDASRLSTPSYQPLNAGIEIGVDGEEAATSHAVQRLVLQELIVLDSHYRERPEGLFRPSLTLFTVLLIANSAARSPLSKASKRAKRPFDEGVLAAAPGYVVASAVDNTAVAGMRFESEAAAGDALAGQLRTEPGRRGELHVIPEAEAVTA